MDGAGSGRMSSFRWGYLVQLEEAAAGQVLGSRRRDGPPHSGAGQEPAGDTGQRRGTRCLCAYNRGSTFLLKYPESCQASASPGGVAGKEREGAGIVIAPLRSEGTEEGNSFRWATVAGQGRRWGLSSLRLGLLMGFFELERVF